MKTIIIPTTKTLDDYLSYSKDFILPLEDFSVDYKYTYTFKEVLLLKEKYKDINIYLIINKPIFNKDLSNLEYILKEIDKNKFNGVLFYDLAVLHMSKRLKLKTELIWNNTHMVTNYKTCDYYFDSGCKYGILSNEITLKEIKKITNNTKMKLWMMVIGYPIMAFSKRKLLTNHAKAHNLEIEKELKVKEHSSQNNYDIFENKFGTSFRKEEIFNGSSIVKELDVDGLIFKEEDIIHNDFIKVLDLFKKFKENKISEEEFISRNTSLIGNNTNFLFNETIYEVKKNG